MITSGHPASAVTARFDSKCGAGWHPARRLPTGASGTVSTVEAGYQLLSTRCRLATCPTRIQLNLAVTALVNRRGPLVVTQSRSHGVPGWLVRLFLFVHPPVRFRQKLLRVIAVDQEMSHADADR